MPKPTAIVLEQYSAMFKYSWNIYRVGLADLRKLSENINIRKDKVYLPSNAGSKETAYQRWKSLVENIKIPTDDGIKNISEDLLATAVELYIADRLSDASKYANVRMSMMSVFLNSTQREDKNVEIIDYIRKATGEEDES